MHYRWVRSCTLACLTKVITNCTIHIVTVQELCTQVQMTCFCSHQAQGSQACQCLQQHHWSGLLICSYVDKTLIMHLLICSYVDKTLIMHLSQFIHKKCCPLQNMQGISSTTAQCCSYPNHGIEYFPFWQAPNEAVPSKVRCQGTLQGRSNVNLCFTAANAVLSTSVGLVSSCAVCNNAVLCHHQACHMLHVTSKA